MRSLALLALAACAAPQKPDGRVTALEDKIASQQREIEDLRKQQPAPDANIGRLEDKVARLETKIAELNNLLAAATPPPPTTRPGRPQPDPDKVYAARTLDAPTEGPANAKVTIVEWSDYACPYCEKIIPTLDDLRKKYGNDLRVVHQSFLVHPSTKTAALAACAANHQGKWRQMSDLLWSDAYHPSKQFDDATIDKIAETAKLDMKMYKADIAGRCVQQIADEMAAAQKFQISGIPAVFINGRYLAGAQPIESFTRIVDVELAKTNAAIKKGVKQDRYYEQEIIGKGLTEVAAP